MMSCGVTYLPKKQGIRKAKLTIAADITAII